VFLIDAPLGKIPSDLMGAILAAYAAQLEPVMIALNTAGNGIAKLLTCGQHMPGPLR